MKQEELLIIIPKIEKYIEYMLNVILKIPRTEKFNIGNEYKTSMYRMLTNAIYINKVGSGFSKEDREYYWNHKNEILNKIIEISYFEISNNQNGTYGLRFPVFKHIRLDKDEISMY